MRFLLYLPLPLLLILCSLNVSSSPLIDTDQKPIRNPTSINNPLVNSSFGFNNYDAIVEQYRLKHDSRVIKPLALESEAASEPNITENYDNLSIDELKTKLESEEGNVAKLTKDIAEANEELKKKEEEAKGPFEEYEKAMEKWTELDGIYKDKKKPYTDLEYKFGNATKVYNDAKAEFEKMDNMVKEQEKLEEKIKKAEQEKNDFDNVDTELAKAETRKTALTTEIPDQNKRVNDISDKISTATRARDEAQREFEGAQGLFDLKNCENSADSDCPTYKTRLKTAEAAYKKTQNDLNQLNEDKRLAQVKLQELKDEESKLPDRIDLLKGYKDENDYHGRTIKNNLKNLKNKQKEYQPLEENKERNKTAAANFETATETMQEAQTAVNEYDTAGITQAKQDAAGAYGYFRLTEDNRNKLNKELDSMKKHLKELQKDLEQSNAILEAIKRKIEEVTAAEARKEPGTGSTTTIAVSVALALIFLLALALGVTIFVNRKNGRNLLANPLKKRAKKDDKEAQNSNPPNPSAKPSSDHSVNSKGSGSNQAAPTAAAAAASANETAPPPAANAADPPPVVQQNMKILHKYLSDLDPDGFTYEKFLDKPEATESVKARLKGIVDPNSIVRTKGKIFIFNNDEVNREIWVLWTGHLLFRFDARDIPVHPLDLDTPFDKPIEMCKNPNPDKEGVHWDHSRHNFFLVVNQGRKTLQQMMIDKALTGKSMQKWKKTLMEKHHERMQAGRTAAEGFFATILWKITCFKRKIAAWTWLEEPVDPDWLRNELEQVDIFDFLLMYANIVGNRKEAADVLALLNTLNSITEECRKTKTSPSRSEMRQLRKEMWKVDKFLDAGGEFMKVVYLQRPEAFRGEGSDEQVRSDELPKEGESAERSEAGSDQEDEKTRSSDRSNSDKDKRDKRSPKKNAIKKQKKKQDKSGRTVYLHKERIITEDGAPIPDVKAIFEGETRKPYTADRCRAEMERIEKNAKSQDLLHQDHEDKKDLLKTAFDCIKQDKQYITKKDNMETVSIGDLHGNVDSLLYIQNIFGGVGSKEWKKRRYVYTGDFVDRGKKSLDLIHYVYCLRILYPDNVILLRGNHESYETNIHYGFYLECQDRFKDENNERCGKDMHFYYNYVFSHMSIVCNSNGYLHSHGGMSEFFPKNLEDMNELIPKFMWEPQRVCQLAAQLMWSDPCFGISEWHGGSRSRMFGENVVYEFLKDHPEIIMIVRAHQVMNNGQELFAGDKLLSLFSTTAYSMPGYPNRAAVLISTPDRVAALQHIVGVTLEDFERFKKGDMKEIRARLIEEHNYENLIPCIKADNYKPPEPECKSETVRMC